MIYKKIAINMAIFGNICEDVAKEFIDHRLNIKKPLTQGAFDRAITAAIRCEKLGISAGDAILLAIDKGWQGIVYEYVAAEISRRMTAMPALSPRPTRERSLMQDLTDTSWAN